MLVEFLAAFKGRAHELDLGGATTANWVYLKELAPDALVGHNWPPMSVPEHTSNHRNHLVPYLAKKLGLEVAHEVVLPTGRMDAAFYRIVGGQQQHVVAYEHEQQVNDRLRSEMANLIASPAKLKVLVTYPWPGREQDETQFARGLCRNALEQNNDEDIRFLLILGIPDGTWQYYVWPWPQCAPAKEL